LNIVYKVPKSRFITRSRIDPIGVKNRAGQIIAVGFDLGTSIAEWKCLTDESQKVGNGGYASPKSCKVH